MKVLLCCGKGGCPTVEFNDDGAIVITDDDGGEVTLTKGEVEKLKDALNDD